LRTWLEQELEAQPLGRAAPGQDSRVRFLADGRALSFNAPRLILLAGRGKNRYHSQAGIGNFLAHPPCREIKGCEPKKFAYPVYQAAQGEKQEPRDD